jgi:methionine-rich copper-binding protein CopC
MPIRTTLFAFCLFTAPALAHAHLTASDPAANAVLKTAPARIELHFTEPLEPAFSSVIVTDKDGHVMDAAPPSAEGTVMRLSLKKLGPGRYRVSWISVAVDTHRLTGAYFFSVAP